MNARAPLSLLPNVHRRECGCAYEYDTRCTTLCRKHYLGLHPLRSLVLVILVTAVLLGLLPAFLLLVGRPQ
jgi:hypothetical protein